MTPAHHAAAAQPALEADYLIVGSGLAGMAFADTLIIETDARVVIVDRHDAPGGHWNDAYPFVRLHQPSFFYGVESRPLGNMSVQQCGYSKGLLQAASAAEIMAYYDAVMHQQLLPTGRVQYFPKCRYDGDGRFTSQVTGAQRQVKVRRRVVDTTSYATSVPSTHQRAYAVAPAVRCVTPNDLPSLIHSHPRYTVVGSGKTGMDTCLWLLQHGVQPDRIRWIMPRDAWWVDRVTFQYAPDHFEACVRNAAIQLEALAEASSVANLFERLEAGGALVRLDRNVKPVMFHGASVSIAELDALRTIGDVVRLGRVQRIESDRMVLDQGEIAAGVDDLYINCSANGAGFPEPVPVFSSGKITTQLLKTFQPSFSAALIAHIEASYADDATKNGLCRVVPPPQHAASWLTMMAATMSNTRRWAEDAELMAWIMKSRLDPLPKLMRSAALDDEGRQLVQRARKAIKPAVSNMHKLLAELGATEGPRQPNRE